MYDIYTIRLNDGEEEFTCDAFVPYAEYAICYDLDTAITTRTLYFFDYSRILVTQGGSTVWRWDGKIGRYDKSYIFQTGIYMG